MFVKKKYISMMTKGSLKKEHKNIKMILTSSKIDPTLAVTRSTGVVSSIIGLQIKF